MSSVPAQLIVMALGVVFVHGPAAGQTLAEFRGGLAVGSHTATAAGLDHAPRLSYEASIVRQITPRLRAYGGSVRTGFGCEEGFCLDRDLTVTRDHGVLGTEVGAEGEPADSGPGVHAGAGYTFGSGRVRFLPGVSYRWLSAKTPSGSDHAVAVGLGVGIRLGS